MNVSGILIGTCALGFSKELFISVLTEAVFECTFQVRYWLLALAALDRYYAVCKPFQYATSKLVNNIGKLAAVAWTLNTLLVLAKAFMSPRFLCLISAFYPVDAKLTDFGRHLDIIIIMAVILPSIVSTILLIKISIELKRMKRRRERTEEDAETRAATRYIIGTCIMFYISIVPSVAFVVFCEATESLEAICNGLTALSLLAQVTYGIGNVILYGLLNKTYIAVMRSMCRHLCNADKVYPQ